MSAMHLRVRTAAGVQTITNDGVVLTVNATGRITDVTFGPTPTVVAAIPAFDGTNTYYEYGLLNDAGGIDAIFTNRDNIS